MAKSFTADFIFTLEKSTVDYPSCNGQMKRSKQLLIKMFTNIMVASKSDLDHNLYATLWVFCTSYGAATRHTPFQWSKVLMLVEFLVPTL